MWHFCVLNGQALYNPQVQQPQYYQQLYGTSSSTMGSPYYYGYSFQAPIRSTYSTTPQPQGQQRLPGSSYIYYPMQMEGSFSTYPPPPLQTTRQSFPSSTGNKLIFSTLFVSLIFWTYSSYIYKLLLHRYTYKQYDIYDE